MNAHEVVGQGATVGRDTHKLKERREDEDRLYKERKGKEMGDEAIYAEERRDDNTEKRP